MVILKKQFEPGLHPQDVQLMSEVRLLGEIEGFRTHTRASVRSSTFPKVSSFWIKLYCRFISNIKTPSTTMSCCLGLRLLDVATKLFNPTSCIVTSFMDNNLTLTNSSGNRITRSTLFLLKLIKAYWVPDQVASSFVVDTLGIDFPMDFGILREILLQAQVRRQRVSVGLG